MTVSSYTGRGGVKSWRYSFTYTAGGRQRHAEKRGFATKRDAQEAEGRRRIEVASLDGAAAGDGTVADYLRSWILRYEASGSRKVSTVYNVKRHVGVYLAPRLEGVKMRRLTLDVVQRLTNELHASGGENGQPLSGKTVGNIVGTLHKALTDAVKMRVLPYNAADGVDLPRRTQYEGEAYDAAEMRLLLAYLSKHDDPAVSVVDYALIRVAFATGLRRGEVCGLRWKDVDLVERRLNVRVNRIVVGGTAVETDPKSRAGRRTVTFDAETGDALGRLRNAQEAAYETARSPLTDDDYVASRLDGQPVHPVTLTHRFQRHAKRAGLKRVRLHDTRASHVQESYALGVDPVTVSRRVGHSRTSTTLDLYGRLLPSHDHEAADLIGATLSESVVKNRTTDETSYALRTPSVGNDRNTRTKQDVEPASDIGGTTESVGKVEATSGIERSHEWSENALY
jgi:integrase